MVVGFGFSVGDFLATLNLVATIIGALRSASHSASIFRDLLNELLNLERALIQVKHIDLDDSQRFEEIALYQAATQCQRSIDGFWNRIQKYQPHFSRTTTTSTVKDAWMKIKWTMCEKKEVDGFRAEIQAHTSSILVLLGAIQANATTKNARNQREQYKSLAGSIQSFAMQAMGKMSAIMDGVSKTALQSATLVQTCAQILQTNLRVFQMVYDIQLFVTTIPGQVQRQQPVYFLDPLNRESPFHLEFVRSAEALRAVLKVNLEPTQFGPEMIDRGDFVIEELGTQNPIDITQNWETCFTPGQRVGMSMVFREEVSTSSSSSCPRCRHSTDDSSRLEVVCSQCGTTYRRVQGTTNFPRRLRQRKLEAPGSSDAAESFRGRVRERRAKRIPAGDEIAAMAMFRRLQIVATSSASWILPVRFETCGTNPLHVGSEVKIWKEDFEVMTKEMISGYTSNIVDRDGKSYQPSLLQTQKVARLVPYLVTIVLKWRPTSLNKFVDSHEEGLDSCKNRPCPQSYDWRVVSTLGGNTLRKDGLLNVSHSSPFETNNRNVVSLLV
ncbi:hypothetical protein FB567DRAFT_547668 [Paraphoma chrysanthemicola]|uniref:Fungal N-terminal domain-containing protein n=1 Tax=Paraphoma chrysanthemicola TaxID=798071 RepID=A0A8K0R7K9_9PLEO|nr:hypothetical protein FB567DRAFT_547668 [Paraphoma chrysanthemicola]